MVGCNLGVVTSVVVYYKNLCFMAGVVEHADQKL